MNPAQGPSNLLRSIMGRARPRESSREADSAAAPFPPVLTGGESTGHRAKVDWCTCTWWPDPEEHIPATIMALLSRLMGGVVGEDCSPIQGYERAVRVYVPFDGKPVYVARVDYGGTHHRGRARLDLTGTGCGRVLDWDALRVVLEGWRESKLTRVDLAVDCLSGEWGVEDALEWWQQGDFIMGGRNPRHSLVGDWGDPDGSKYGRTVEIGRRTNGKMLRAYEKGRQLGDQASDWTRFEVELRNIDRDLPFDVLTDCDPYFVGAYKCLERVLDAAAARIATHQQEGTTTLEVMTERCMSAYGRLVNVLRLTGLSTSEVVDSIARPGVPRRLERAALGGFITGPSPGPTH